MYALNGKVAIVTGAAGKQGLGRAIAVRLASEGADVVVTDVSSDSRTSGNWGGLADVVEEIEAMNRRGLAVVGDVANAADVDRMVASVLEHFGRIDILVNNAGALAGSDRVPVVELEEQAWDQVQRVNVKGTFLCCRAVARAMIQGNDGGRIINISSIAGQRGVARFAAYCASKFAVRGLTESLAAELAQHRINVNAICPALIDTERVDDMAAVLAPEGTTVEDHREQMVSEMISATPLGRMGQPQDVAQIAAFLASTEADFLTGLSIRVSGGAW